MNKITNGDNGAVRRRLDGADVLAATVAQLRKDLSLEPHVLVEPAIGEDTFEQLRDQVVPVLQSLIEQGAHPFQVAMYRLDIPEPHLYRTMLQGGVHALAREAVLRCLQKVLTRSSYAGRS